MSNTEHTDQYPEVSGEESAIVPPQSAPKPEWPKKIRTLSASELDRLTIDSNGRFYWDNQLVNYEPPKPADAPQSQTIDVDALALLDRAAIELSDRKPGEPGAEGDQAQAAKTPDEIKAVDQFTPVVPAVDARPLTPMQPVAIPTRWPAEKVRVSLSIWQSLGVLVLLAAMIIGAIGLAAQGWVAVNEWGCRIGTQTANCPPPPPPPPAPPPRPDIPA
jgi:hypothetical protein